MLRGQSWNVNKWYNTKSSSDRDIWLMIRFRMISLHSLRLIERVKRSCSPSGNPNGAVTMGGRCNPKTSIIRSKTLGEHRMVNIISKHIRQSYIEVRYGLTIPPASWYFYYFGVGSCSDFTIKCFCVWITVPSFVRMVAASFPWPADGLCGSDRLSHRPWAGKLRRAIVHLACFSMTIYTRIYTKAFDAH